MPLIKEKLRQRKKRFWVWVWNKNGYLNERGEERPEFDPAFNAADRTDDWSTCHSDTKAGDLVLLYRSAPRSDIAYLWEVKSDTRIWRQHPIGTLTEREWLKRFNKFVRSPHGASYMERKDKVLAEAKQLGITDADVEGWLVRPRLSVPKKHRDVWRQYMQMYHDTNQAMGLPPDPEFASDWEGSLVCDYEPRFRLNHPLRRATMAADPYLFKNWAALRGNFQQRVYPIPDHIWVYLTKLLSSSNPGFSDVVNRLTRVRISDDIESEQELEDALERSIGCLGPEFRLTLYVSPDGISGRQFPCKGNPGPVGFIDLLCCDKQTGDFVVIELKITRAGLPAYAQLRSYMGWVREHLAFGKKVRGLLVADGFDQEFQYARDENDGITILTLDEVRGRLGSDVPNRERTSKLVKRAARVLGA